MLHLSLPDFWDFEQRWCRFSTCTGEMHIFHMTEKTQQLAPSVYIHQVILKQYMINVQFYFLPLVLPFLKLPCNPLLTSSGCCEPLDSHLISAFTNETPSNKEKKEKNKTKTNYSPSIFGNYIISMRSTTSRSPLSSIPYLTPTIFQFLPTLWNVKKMA